MIIETVQHAREFVYSERGGRLPRSVQGWRRLAGDRRANALHCENRGRVRGAEIEREIAAIFDKAADDTEREIAERR